VNKKALSVLDRKLAAAAADASASAKSRKRQREEEERPPLKRRKTEPVFRVETSKSQRGKYARRGRHSLPAPKVLRTYGRGKGRKPRSPSRSPSPSKSDSKDDEVEEVESEAPPEEAEKPTPKVRRKRKASTPQPTLSRAQRAEEREKVRRWQQKVKEEAEEDSPDEDAASPARKRSSADIDGLEDRPKKKVPRAKEKQLPLQKVIPRPSSGFRGGQLFAKPNPLSYALHAWASPLVSTASSSEDELPPVTPEDELTVELPSDTCGPAFTSPPTIDLTFKPTPFSFARRRWGSGSTPPSDETKRRALTSTPSSPHQGLSESQQDDLFFNGDPPSSSLSEDSAIAPLRPPWCPNPIKDNTNRYPSPMSSLDSLSESSGDNVRPMIASLFHGLLTLDLQDESPTQRTVKRTPLSSPLRDSDSSPLPLLRRVFSPISSPLSSLDSSPRENKVRSNKPRTALSRTDDLGFRTTTI
jgi:histone-lysine N-methyltransferase SUV420H